MTPNVYVAVNPADAHKRKFAEVLQQEASVIDPYITSGDILLRIELENGNRNYSIEFKDQGNKIFPERLLREEDWAYMTHMAIYLAKEDTNATAGTSAGTLNCGNFPWMTHPDPNIFDGVDANGNKEADCLNTLYWGSDINIEVGGKKIWKNKLGHHFMFRPERPFETASVTGLANNSQQMFGPGAMGQGYYPLDSEVALKGTDTNNFLFTLAKGNVSNLQGGFDATATANSLRNVVYVSFKTLFFCPEIAAGSASSFCRVGRKRIA